MTLLPALFLALTLLYAAIILFFYTGILRAKREANPDHLEKLRVSVLIPARNEADTIVDTLNSLQQQDYPRELFEVIIIDDQSSDDTFQRVADFIRDNDLTNFRVLLHEHDGSRPTYKKSAIAFGLAQAQGEIILTTDADCRVLPTWISSMVRCYGPQSGLVAGLVKFELPENARLFHYLQAIEFAGLVYCGVGAIGNRYPLICNASNLSYRRKVYDEVGGFDGHEHVPSGDDDLFMQTVHHKTQWKVRYNLDPAAINRTAPVETIGEFFNQRARWASKGSHYPGILTLLLLLSIYLYYLGLLVLTPVTFLGGFPANILGIAFACKLIPEFLVVREALAGLGSRSLLRYFGIAQIVQIPYIVIAGFAGFFNLFRWKRPK